MINYIGKDPRVNHVLWDFGSYRVLDLQVSPRERDDVEVQQMQDGNWQRVASYNSLSCDYAYTNARDAARAMASGGAGDQQQLTA